MTPIPRSTFYVNEPGPRRNAGRPMPGRCLRDVAFDALAPGVAMSVPEIAAAVPPRWLANVFAPQSSIARVMCELITRGRVERVARSVYRRIA